MYLNIHNVLAETKKLLQLNNFLLSTYDKEEDRLYVNTWIHNDQPLPPFSDKVHGLVGWIITHKASLLIRDWEQEKEKYSMQDNIITQPQRSWLGVPMFIGKEIIGAISIQHSHPNMFDTDTQQLLETIASQTAIVLGSVDI